MTLILRQGTKPEGLEVIVSPIGPTIVCLGTYEIPIEDFLTMVDYVLTNTDLREDDPRQEFVERVHRLQKVPGFNEGNVRLESSNGT